jgi:hypothetical protein
MSVREEFRLSSNSADKGIVWRNGSVVTKAQHFADIIAQILSLQAKAIIVSTDTAKAVAIANSHVESLIRTKHQASCKIAGGFPRIGHENLANISKSVVSQTPAGDG